MDDKEKSKFRERINCDKQKRDKSWTRYFSPNYIHYEKLVRRISWIKARIIGPKLLDVGCGPGIICDLSSEKEDITEIHGLDLQEDILVQARTNAISNKINFHCGFAEDLSFEDNYFDTVTMGEVLEHVFSEKEAVAEAFRVLKFNGRLIITVPNDGKLSFGHVRSFSKDSLTELIVPYLDIKEMMNIDNFLACMCEKKQ
jgi:ubiquinone/menaquinone biosynthesis C-methylase UbiE